MVAMLMQADLQVDEAEVRILLPYAYALSRLLHDLRARDTWSSA